MFFGLPLRTTKETIEVVTRPSVGAVLPGRLDQAGVDQPGHVRLGGERDDVGLLARLDGAGLVAGGAERGLELDALALRRLVEVGDDLVVDDLRGRVCDERQRALRAVAAGRGSVVPSVRLIRSAAAADGHQGGGREQRDGEPLSSPIPPKLINPIGFGENTVFSSGYDEVYRPDRLYRRGDADRGEGRRRAARGPPVRTPGVGLEPTTLRLTVECSAIELPRTEAALRRRAIVGGIGLHGSAGRLAAAR